MLMFLFEALFKCLDITVYIKGQNILNSEKKNEHKMRQPSILPVPEPRELFWDRCCCSLLWGYCSFVLGLRAFSYLISVLVCVMQYQETAFRLLSYEKAAEKKTSFIMRLEAVPD